MIADTNAIKYDEDGATQKKLTLAFINHFITQTANILNNFSVQCESKLMEFEVKMQKIEAALIILETKLNSIPGLDVKAAEEKGSIERKVVIEAPVEIEPQEEGGGSNETDDVEPAPDPPERDPQYEKYYKMLQFGVPLQAVKLKMIQEEMDPEKLVI